MVVALSRLYVKCEPGSRFRCIAWIGLQCLPREVIGLPFRTRSRRFTSLRNCVCAEVVSEETCAKTHHRTHLASAVMPELFRRACAFAHEEQCNNDLVTAHHRVVFYERRHPRCVWDQAVHASHRRFTGARRQSCSPRTTSICRASDRTRQSVHPTHVGRSLPIAAVVVHDRLDGSRLCTIPCRLVPDQAPR